MPDPCTICDSTANDLCIDLPCAEQATTPRGRSESCESELLRGKLPLDCIKVAFPLEFTVNPDSEEPTFLDRCYNLLVEVNWRRRGGAGAGKVDEFALFRGELHPPRAGPLATRLPGGFEVAASHLRVLAERKEVKVVGKAHCNRASVFLELGVEAGGIEEEEDRGER